MKYVLVQGDGMADHPVDSLHGLTPLEAAHTPNMDRIARYGRLGLVRTIPPGYPSGSPVGTMTILGYDPSVYFTGRGPLEAASMGIDLGETDVAFRCNLVTIGEREGERIMVDFTAGHISSEEGAEIIETIQSEVGDSNISFYPGVGYRHLMVWHGGPVSTRTTPPHDISDRPVDPHTPSGEGSERLAELASAAHKILSTHPVNERRASRGEKRATDIWLWGQGRRPALPTLLERFGLSGGVITAVDVIGGLGRIAGLERIDVPGMTGFFDTNYLGKGEYALKALKKHDFVLIHVEAPDEAGHMGDPDLKVKAIEDFDEKVIGTVLRGIHRFDEWRIMVVPDHATPVSTKTHTDELVPFAILESRSSMDSKRGYSEREAAMTGHVVEEGHLLLGQLLREDISP
ncbi:MAG: cofactor-independent phosphoglycerate mutase [Candidatus Geothermarchaeales archaeon]